MTVSLRVTFILLSFIVLQTIIWSQLRHMQVEWLNVPPAPSKAIASAAGLGDAQFAYRYYALQLQNAGDMGGRTQSLKNYNLQRIAEWLRLGSYLDPVSDVMPFLAAYYFGGVQEEAHDQLRPIVLYLEQAGDSPEGEKWRWLAQAVYLANYKLKDTALALRLAEKLKNMPNPDVPIWARQFSLVVLEQAGEKQAALALALQTIQTEGYKMDPNEIMYMADHICNVLLDPDEAQTHPICQNLPQ